MVARKRRGAGEYKEGDVAVDSLAPRLGKSKTIIQSCVALPLNILIKLMNTIDPKTSFNIMYKDHFDRYYLPHQVSKTRNLEGTISSTFGNSND